MNDFFFEEVIISFINKWDSTINLELLWRQYKRIIKQRGCIALFAQTPFDKVFENIDKF